MKNAALLLACLLFLQVLPSRGEVEPYRLPPPADADPPKAKQPAPDKKPSLDEPPAAGNEAAPGATSAPAPLDDKADMDVSGTLARAAPNSKMHVSVWAKNRGATTWTPQEIRVVVRWVDFDAGTRRRWSFNWIKSVVAPKEQFRLALDVAVPPNAGRFKLIYSLVRVPKGGKVASPAYDARQDAWPGQFAAVAFAVNIGQTSSATP